MRHARCTRLEIPSGIRVEPRARRSPLIASQSRRSTPMRMLQSSEFTIAVTATVLMGLVTVRDAAAEDTLRAIPFAFIGTSDDCRGPPVSHIVTAALLGGEGLTDNGSANTKGMDHYTKNQDG